MAASSLPHVSLRLDSLTAMRFFAALGVVLCHGTQVFTPGNLFADAAWWGQLGVDFFFILSGFVLAWSYQPSRTTKRFYWLRFARVWPLHAVTAAMALALGAAFSLNSAALNAALLQSWHPEPGVHFGLNGPAWTLSCEAFFYLCFPLIIQKLMALSDGAVKAVAGGSLLALLAVPTLVHFTRALWPYEHWLTQVLPAQRLPQFVLGMAVAVLLQRGAAPAVKALLPAVALGTIVAAATLTRDDVPVWLVSFAVTPMLGLLIIGVAQREMRNPPRFLVDRILVKLGEWSFALYLTHLFLLRPIHDHLIQGPAGLAVSVMAAVLLSAAAHELLERPVERWLRSTGVGRSSAAQLTPN